VATTPQNATPITPSLSHEIVLDLDEVFRARLVEAGAVDQTRRPEEHERVELALELLTGAIADSLE
jgi:hypothetical protein